MSRYFGAHTLQGEWHSLLPRYLVLQDRVEGKQILDIGCGTGIGASLLLEMGAGGVNGIDHRPEVIELARIKHAKQGLNFQVMFWEELDFPENAFDMVLCLDPQGPVTDSSLLLEIQRVLRDDGEYICAIERRNVDGFESLLPRYGYDTTGEEIDLSDADAPVPQIGKLDDLFDTVVSVDQRPRFSFVFDRPGGDDEQQFRHRGSNPQDSGLWVGDDPRPTDGAEGTDPRGDRWLKSDDRLVNRDDEPAAVELLFCGAEQMPAPTLREVEMPYHQMVERLHQLFSELQLRQHPDSGAAHTASAEAGGDTGDFEDRRETSVFRNEAAVQRLQDTDPSPAPTRQSPPPQAHSDAWQQVHRQLDEMNRMYRGLRDEMESLFVRTRRELAERDRYIEQLVETVHQWKHEVDQQSSAPVADPAPDAHTDSETDDDSTDDFERRPTSVFRRPGDLPDLDNDDVTDSDDMNDGDDIEAVKTTEFNPDLAPTESNSEADELSEADDVDGDALSAEATDAPKTDSPELNTDGDSAEANSAPDDSTVESDDSDRDDHQDDPSQPGEDDADDDESQPSADLDAELDDADDEDEPADAVD